jgi:hypothetical protein
LLKTDAPEFKVQTSIPSSQGAEFVGGFKPFTDQNSFPAPVTKDNSMPSNWGEMSKTFDSS